MRLFIAVNFSDAVKVEISNIINKLRPELQTAHFTDVNNIHLTVVFVGETDRTKEIKEVLDSLTNTGFNLSINSLGSFKRDKGSIIWLGVKPDNNLNNLYNVIYHKLKEKGFLPEDRRYTPHITIARNAVFKDDKNIDNYKYGLNINNYVGSVSLMKSERINGKLIYTEIHKKELGGENEC